MLRCRRHRRVQELPAGLGALPRLQQLGLRGNPLPHHMLRLLDAGCDGVLALLRPGGCGGVLRLDGCGWEGLPLEVCGLPGRATALLELHLSNNRLRDLPQVRWCLLALLHMGDVLCMRVSVTSQREQHQPCLPDT